MANTSISQHDVEESLRPVMQSLIDGQEGFKKLGDEVKDPVLKKYFWEESLRRAQFRGDLEMVLHQEGVDELTESGTVAGAVHRAWGDLKAAMGGSDHTLLVTAEQGEDEALSAYEKALTKDLPLLVRKRLYAQWGHIQMAHGYIKAEREASR